MLRRVFSPLTCLALLALASPASAQFGGGSTIGGSSMGGSSGSSFGGGGSSFGGSGGSSSSGIGGGFSLGSGLTTTTSQSRGTTNTNTVGATSPIGTSYSNPVQQGFKGLTGSAGPLTSFTGTGTTTGSRSTFGQPVFNISTTGTTGTTGTAGIRVGGAGGGYGTGATGTGSISRATTPSFATSAGVRRAATYVAEPRFAANLLPPSQLQADVQSVLANSSRLTTGAGIQVGVDGGVVVLRGGVASPDELRIAEDVIRLVPGVGDVRNELVVQRP